MTGIRGLWQDKRSNIYYLRRKVPVDLRSSFNCGECFKVSLGTADLREAKKKFAVANGEYEQKLAHFRRSVDSGKSGSLTPEEAAVLVERYLKARSGTGFAIGGSRVAFMLQELDRAVKDLSGERTPTAQEMSPGEWIAYRKRTAGSDGDDEFSAETLRRIEADHEKRFADPGTAWFAYQRRVPRRRWRPLLMPAITELKREMGLEEGMVPGVDEPLADALAEALHSPEVRHQIPVAASARRRAQPNRAQPEMKLSALLKKWNEKRKPRPKSYAEAERAATAFTSYIGDIGIGEITADDCFEFRDAVEMMPASMPRAHRNLAFADAHAIYATKPGIKRLSPASVKKYLGAIQALLGFAFQERFIGLNPSAGIAVEGYRKKGNRRPFEKDLCRDADIPKDVHDQLTGHAPADVGGGYGLGRAILNLAAHLKRLELEFIDWSAIVEASRR